SEPTPTQMSRQNSWLGRCISASSSAVPSIATSPTASSTQSLRASRGRRALGRGARPPVGERIEAHLAVASCTGSRRRHGPHGCSTNYGFLLRQQTHKHLIGS